MNTVTKRAYILLAIIIAFIAGVAILGTEFALKGESWAINRVNGHLYSGNEVKIAGKIFDRNGVVLAESKDGERFYSSDKAVRMATLHTVGDTYGYISTGAHTVCRDMLTDYSFVDGIYTLVNTGEGNDISLTIDAALCVKAYEALDGKKGAIGVYNYKTGEIVCMVSAPTYDPENKPENMDSDDEYEAVYMNRLLSGVFTPGSTFKTVTTVAAIENLSDVQNREFVCNGSHTTAQGGKVICNGTHGKVGFGKAFTKSCNSAYAQMGIEMGAGVLSSTASSMGFGKSFNISGVNTAKSRFDLGGAVDIDIGWASIGQYTTLVNPLHLMMIAGSIASDGSTPVPYFVVDSAREATSERLINQSTASQVKTMMRNNVINNYGDDLFPGMSFGGKTGTAEVADEADHAWFMGFSADESFPYAIVVLAENGGKASEVAVPIASEVMIALKNSL